jgi:PAS domain S-box-containing protein
MNKADYESRIKELELELSNLKSGLSVIKKVEEKLRESEHLLSTTFNAVNAPIFNLAVEGKDKYRFISINKAFSKVTGLKLEQIVGKQVNEVIPEPSLTMVLGKYKLAIDENRIIQWEETSDYPTGQLIGEVSIAPYFDEKGRCINLIGSVLDVTERRHTADALMESEKLYRSLFENMLNGFAYCQMHFDEKERPSDFTYLSVNNAFETQTGLKNVVGKRVTEVIPGIRDTDMELLEIYGQVSKTGKPENFEMYVKALNMWFSVSVYSPKQGYFVAVFEVITERKQAEFKLAQSNQYNSQIINSVQEGIIVLNQNLIYQVWNPFMEKMSGIPASMVLGKHVSEFLPFLEEAGVIANVKKSLIGEPTEAIDLPYNLPEFGISGWASYRINPLKDVNGEIIGIIGTIHDITVRKLAEEALVLEKQRLSSIIQGTNTGTWEWNIRTGETLFNERWAEIIGYTLEEISPLSVNTWFKYCHPDDLKVSNELLEKHFNGELDFYECEIRMKHKNGDWIWVLDRGQVNKRDEEGKPLLMSGTHQDISERKKAEEELTIQRHFFEQMFRQSSISTQILDSEGWCEKINPKLTELFGVKPENIEGRVYNIFKDEAIKRGGIIPHLERTFFEGKAAEWEVLFDIGLAADSQGIKVKEKKKMWYYNWSYPILDKDGIVSKVIIQHSDITARKQVESDLIKAKEKAEESDRLKSAFLTNMSHEIRTPMNGILGFTELLKEPNLSSDDLQDYIQTIQISGARMLNTINSIVDISKIESGLIGVDIKETNLNEEIELTYKFFKPEVEIKGLQFLFKNGLPTNEAIIKTDNEKVYGILTNLVRNAIKFTFDGSIEFGYKKKGEYLEFFVKDTGVGIPQNQHGIIFERFRQGSESYNRGYEGSGLGLSISKSYVEMLGGEIWVESEEGLGSTFYFTIPYNPISEKEIEIMDAVSAEHKEVEIKKLKILIVEDDEISYSLLSRTIQKISKEVLHAMTGVEAVEACRNNPDLDLVLMDIRMPQMNGLEATHQIRRFNKDVIIIAQTAYAFDSDSEKAIEAGCNDYISKPINKTLLYEAIKKYIN